jgi:protein TonB
VPAAETKPAVPVPAADHSAANVPGAEVVDRVVPEVPAQILGTIQGRVTVKVRVRVDRFGAVTDVDLNSPARSKYFDRVALDAARRWKFKPAQTAGADVESTRLVRFEFWAKGCETTSDQVQP